MLTIADNLHVLGDVHLGRTFKNGVPLDRRGEREESLFRQFDRELNSVQSGTVVQVGDLFDRYVVPLHVIWRTAWIIKGAAERHLDARYIFLAGNHDLSRDIDKRSAFEILSMMLEGVQNVAFHTASMVFGPKGNLMSVPWNPMIPAAEAFVILDGDTYDFVFGHWDVEDFGNNNPNLIPIKELSQITTQVVSGHVHKPSQFSCNGISVHVVGAMQPLAHGEEAVPDKYITLTLPELETINLDLTNRCIRLLLNPGEVAPLPHEVGCLQLTVKRNGVEEGEQIDVEFEDFDMRKLFSECLEGTGLTETVLAKYDELRSVE